MNLYFTSESYLQALAYVGMCWCNYLFITSEDKLPSNQFICGNYYNYDVFVCTNSK